MKVITSNIYFLVGLLLTLGLLWPLFSAPFFTHHDDVHIIRLYEMDKCIKDYQIPCRWVPDLGGLYGYPIFNYYAPLPYYFGELIYLLTDNLIFSVKTMFAVSFVGAYLFMYLLSSKIWGKLGGSIAAIFYSYAPYHALDFYVRGAMGEMWALMFFPAVFWAAFKLHEKTDLRRFLLFGSILSALILSHNLSTFLFIPVLVLWVSWLYLKERKNKYVWLSLGSFLLSIILSAFYLFPMILEKDLVHVETTTFGYFSYTEHFKGLRKLLLERNWDYGSSIREVPGGEKDGMSYQIGWVHLLGWALALFGAKIYWNRNRWLSWVIIGSSIMILISIFMIHPRSLAIWKSVPPLKFLQFPWRFLLLIIFLISFISGGFFSFNFKRQSLIWAILVILVVSLNFSFFKPARFIYVTDQELMTGDNWDKQIKRSIFDFLPIYAKEPPAELAPARYQILTGNVKISDFQEGTNWISFNADTKDHTIIRLSQYYFPNWKIWVDGKEIPVEYKNNGLGLMTIILGKGFHRIEAKLLDTQIRTIGNTLSSVGLFVFIILFLTQIGSIKKWVSYYRKGLS